MPFIQCDQQVSFAADKLRKVALFNTPQMVCDLYCLEPGQRQNVHHHDGEAKMYYVIEGRGEFTLNDESRTLGPGEMAAAPAGEPHGVANHSDQRLVILVAIAPNPNLRKPS